MIVGSGTLITFPVLLALGVPPVTANVSNTLGLVPGSVSGAIGYRRELAGQRRRLVRLGLASLAAPIRDLSGTVVAAISVGAPITRFRSVPRKLMAESVVEAGEAVSRRLGWSPESTRRHS